MIFVLSEPNNMKIFSIVIPVYYNEPNLGDTIPNLIALATQLPDYKLELVFVDDGSKDRSLPILLEYQTQYPDTIKIVKLTRNFGAMAALLAGLTVASGDCVGIIAADLQDPPELFLQMLRHWENGIKAIYAVRQDREESPVQKFFSNTYYRLMRQFAIPDYPPGGFDFLLIDRQVVQEVIKIQEKNTHLMLLIFWLGFEAVFIPYIRRARMKGKSRWTLSKKVKLLVDSFVSFSYVPIRILSALGLILALGSFLYGAFITLGYFLYGIEVKGWVPTMIVLTITAGIQMTMLGVLGEYLWRTLDETRKRPFYVIDHVYEGETLE
jgi:dolichol-phosphate mannosyltransferase